MRRLLILAVLVFGQATANIVDSEIRHDVRRLIPLSDAFGFAKGGKITITITDVAIYRNPQAKAPYDAQNFGFFLSPVDADQSLAMDLADTTSCVLGDIEYLFEFNTQPITKLINGETTSWTYQATVETGNLVYLYFANCEIETPVSFTVHVEMYNVYDGDRIDYLSLGDRQLVVVYWVMFALFSAGTGGWAYYVYRHRAHSHKIHYLMIALGGAKVLTLLSQAFMFHYIEWTGHADGWNIAYYIFTFLRGMLFFTVIVLVGTGWSYMKPFLGDKEKRILMVVVPLQVFANLAIIITDEESVASADWFTWRDVFHLVDIICCCAILFPIVWSIKYLREASQTDGKAARNLEKLTLFRQFYVMVVVYIYFTRIIVYLLKSTLEYEYTWASEAADQAATLAFYAWTATKFRPQEANPYLRLVSEDEVEMT